VALSEPFQADDALCFGFVPADALTRGPESSCSLATIDSNLRDCTRHAKLPCRLAVLHGATRWGMCWPMQK
jgi:hypothetical protein